MAAPVLLAFDVFGTVVDWHGGIVREVTSLCPEVDADAFALAWRAGYQPAMQRVRSGELGWTRIDALHRLILDQVLADFGQQQLNEAQRQQLNTAWHRLDPWPDTLAGMARLKTRFILCSLSNGNISLLTHMAKRAGLPWDCILSAETFGHYKPDRETYLGAARLFDLAPEQVLMVAAHQDDLVAARGFGLQTAYIERPLEYGVRHPKSVSPDPVNDWHARDLVHLAEQLAC
jgi:2-haloacid dehalogenase